MRFGLRGWGAVPGQVPEPSTLVLLGTGLASLAWAARRKMSRQSDRSA
ncbi:MAG: PEP-CTERM sorting domain-containing protein [Candidatus Tectomicrobia bacterium]|uniref:PEP-CTERM sorting domain-containing protein n=1 Tax=Tectimicrobiota bacterium TaxID=2528274 RepID=A0A937VZS0_UNCTE|nr:PEP-CTERM sorting domain-containing protein [Candidatus Tectomicrobia bacterium]